MYCVSHGVQQTIGITVYHIEKLNECVAQPNRVRTLEPLIEVVPKVYGSTGKTTASLSHQNMTRLS